MKAPGVVVINQDSGYLVVDVINELTEAGLKVSLLAGRVVTRNKELSSTVTTRRIIRYNRSSKLRRLISWVIAFLQILILLKTKYRKDHLLIYSNPPFTSFLPLFCRNKFSMMVFDVYPEVLIQMGLIRKNSWLDKIWANTNRKVFSRAASLFTLTEGMAALMKQYVSERKIEIVPLWVDTHFFKPIPRKDNPFVTKQKLDDRFIVLYSGNLGATHNVEIFADIATRITNPKVLLLIIGEGDQKRILKERIKTTGIKNCLMLPLQDVATIPYSFAAADIAIVSLSSDASNISLPSKTFSFMAAGLPLLCIASDDSELCKLVRRYDNGSCFDTAQIDQIVAFIEALAVDHEKIVSYGKNSLKASDDFTPLNAKYIAEKVKDSVVPYN